MKRDDDPRGEQPRESLLPSYLLQDRATLEDRSRSACLALAAPNDRLLCRVLGRYIMSMDAHDIGITPHLCLDGFWESWITLAIARTLQPGWHCIDVGANHGYYTVLMAAAAGREGRVLAIEPNEGVCDLLDDTIEMNGFAPFTAVARAAADARDAGTVALSVPARRGLLATVVDDPGDPAASVRAVRAVTIDSLTIEWPRVDFVKIDAEGAEHRVWAGMERTLARNPGIVIVLEFTPGRYREPSQFVSSIVSMGFPLRYIDDDGNLAPISAARLVGAPSVDDWWMLYLSRN